MAKRKNDSETVVIEPEDVGVLDATETTEATEATEATAEQKPKQKRKRMLPMNELVPLVIRRHAEGKTLDDIAEETGNSKNTLQQRLTEYRTKYGLGDVIPHFKGGNRAGGPTREERDAAAADEVRKQAEALLKELNGDSE